MRSVVNSLTEHRDEALEEAANVVDAVRGPDGEPPSSTIQKITDHPEEAVRAAIKLTKQEAIEDIRALKEPQPKPEQPGDDDA